MVNLLIPIGLVTFSLIIRMLPCNFRCPIHYNVHLQENSCEIKNVIACKVFNQNGVSNSKTYSQFHIVHTIVAHCSNYPTGPKHITFQSKQIVGSAAKSVDNMQLYASQEQQRGR